MSTKKLTIVKNSLTYLTMGNVTDIKYQLAIKRKIEVVNKYGGKRLSEILKISHPAISKWKVIPPYRAYQIAKLGDFDMEYIRPDLDLAVNL
tara:strand:+ start:756 stop:1031 length:276 start_codon:yes stop_codon:yes gene_type:complete